MGNDGNTLKAIDQETLIIPMQFFSDYLIFISADYNKQLSSIIPFSNL